jgi:predicted metal-dependent HD superfamily phosphohydrolase
MMSVTDAFTALVETSTGTAMRWRYHEPWRHYHWSHPLAMIGHLAAAERDGIQFHDSTAAAAFVLWHDSIYDPQAAAGRNEELSAALCRSELSAPAISVERTVTAILATADHKLPDAERCPDGALLLDVDLAILGAETDDFERYDGQIAAEFAHVEPGAYRAGRARVLRRFLDRERLYVTDWARARWEARARDNLAGAIARLA